MRGVRQLPHSPHGPPCLTNMHWLDSELQRINFPITYMHGLDSELQKINFPITDRIGVSPDSTPVIHAIEKLGEQITARVSPSVVGAAMRSGNPAPPPPPSTSGVAPAYVVRQRDILRQQQTGNTAGMSFGTVATSATANIPILRDISRHLGQLNLLLKGATAAAVVGKVLMPTPGAAMQRLRSLGGIASGARPDDPEAAGWHDAISESVKRARGMASRHILHDAWKKDTKVSPIAESVMKAWKANMPGAIMGRLGKDASSVWKQPRSDGGPCGECGNCRTPRMAPLVLPICTG